MNYYERHLGDYARDTGHLSMLEHGAYTLLLDRYYATEKGIPADEAHRVGRARTRDEKAAVDTVLQEFFHLADGFWVKDRVEGEIEKARGRIEAARENGKHGGRPKKNPKQTQEKPNGFHLGSNIETQPKALHTPSNHQELPTTSGAETPLPDPLWGTGLAFLIRRGIPEKSARQLLGKVRQAAGDIDAGAILARAEADDVSDPVPWLMTAASNAKARAGPVNRESHGKVMTAIMQLEDMKNGLDETRTADGLPALAHARLG